MTNWTVKEIDTLMEALDAWVHVGTQTVLMTAMVGILRQDRQKAEKDNEDAIQKNTAQAKEREGIALRLKVKLLALRDEAEIAEARTT